MRTRERRSTVARDDDSCTDVVARRRMSGCARRELTHLGLAVEPVDTPSRADDANVTSVVCGRASWWSRRRARRVTTAARNSE